MCKDKVHSSLVYSSYKGCKAPIPQQLSNKSPSTSIRDLRCILESQHKI